MQPHLHIKQKYLIYWGYKYFNFRLIMCGHFYAFLTLPFFPTIKLTRSCLIAFSFCSFTIPQNPRIKLPKFWNEKKKKGNWWMEKEKSLNGCELLFFLLCLVAEEQGGQIFWNFFLSEKCRTSMKPDFRYTPFSNEISLSCICNNFFFAFTFQITVVFKGCWFPSIQ